MPIYTNPTGTVTATSGDDTIIVNAPWTEMTTVDALEGHDSLFVQFDDAGPVTYYVADPSNAGFLNVHAFRSALASFVSFDANHVEDVTLHGTSNNDTFNLYIGPNTSSGLTVSLDGAAGQDLLRFNWAQLATGLSFQVSGSTITSDYGSFTNFETFEIRAGSGDDTITTGGGDDFIAPGGGIDSVNAGGGDDHVEVTAAAGGTIDGGTGNDTFVIYDLTSALSGSMTGGAGEDLLSISATLMTSDAVFVVAGGTITSNIGTFSGFEQFQFFAGSGNDTITTGGGDDYLNGGAGNDTISAGDGNDTVGGGGGDDALGGGAGNDDLAGSGGNDVIDGGDGDDTITGDLTNGTFPGDGNDQLSGGAGHDIIYGAGGTDTISGGADNDELYGGSGADYVDGGDGDDRLFGFGENSGPDDSAANTLLGGNGDDVIYTGRGNDTIDGGAGFDTANYATAGAGVTVNLALFGAQDTVGGGIDTLIDIENLTGTQQSDTLTGNAGANVLFGDFGNDVLDGGAGADTLDGWLGNDRYYIDNAGDRIVEGDGQGDDIALVLGTYTLEQGVSVETLVALNQSSTEPLILTGNEFGQSLYGNLGDNYLNGGQGNDYLVGLDGNDNLLGGTGADDMQGGLGNDVYYADQAGDRIFETAGQGSDLVVATASYTLTDGAEVETMSADPNAGNINLTGNEFAQSIYGNAGNNNITGMGGADYLVGGAGNDTYYVDPSDFIGEDVGGGDDTIVIATSYILREGNEIEALVALNQASLAQVDFTGNEFGQSLYGSAGVNNLNGGAGNDYLVGLGGNDFLIGGAGNDNLQGGTGNDLYYVDSGDQIFESANEGDDLAVASQSFVLGAGQSVETLSAAEGSAAINLTGNALGQSIYGNAGANILTSGGGADYLVGGAANDTFILTNAAGVATVGDYAAGDVVDISQYLSVANGTNVVAGGYLRIVGTQLQVDATGGANSFVTVGNVSGSGSVTIRYLSGGGATDVSVARSAGQTEAVVAKSAFDPSHAVAVEAQAGHLLDNWHGSGDASVDGQFDPIAAHFHIPEMI
jgi:serralysin